MGYSIKISPRAQKEIENAIDFYALYSYDAPVKFIAALQETYLKLEENPFLRLRYKNIRAITIDKFPHLLYFVINENKNSIRVLSCFHSKRNPNSRPGVL
jgi:toxin ParE1/3/4